MLTILFYHVSSFFLIIDLYFFIPAVIVTTFIPNPELPIPTGIPTKEAKEEMETHPVTIEAKLTQHEKCPSSDFF